MSSSRCLEATALLSLSTWSVEQGEALRSVIPAQTVAWSAMRLSTRNQLAGTITEIQRGAAMAVVKVQLQGGDTVTSSITLDAATDLGLDVGKAVTVLIKSTDVALGVD